MWLTTAVWFGNRMSLVSGCVGLTRPLTEVRPPAAALVAEAGVAVSGSTMNAPWTLILTLPGRLMVLSISSVDVMVLSLRFGCEGGAGPDPFGVSTMASSWSEAGVMVVDF